MQTTTALRASLLGMRLSVALFFLIWAAEKIVAPEIAIRVADTFYGVTPDPLMLTVTGAAQVALIAAFMVGLWKAWTYGALLLIHTASVLSTVPRLLDPYTPPNHLFWAAVPLVFLLLALFLLREQDRLLTVGGRRTAGETATEPV